MQALNAAPAVPIRDDPLGIITPEVIETYRRDGVVFLKQALDPEWLTLIEYGIRRVQHSGSPNIQTFFPGEPGEFQDMVRHFAVTPEFQRLLYDSPIADMAARVLGSENIWLLFDTSSSRKARSRAARPGTRTCPTTPSPASRSSRCGSPSIPCRRRNPLN